MKKNQNLLKRKLLNKENTLGSWISIPHPCVVDIMSDAGFDWLAVDLEHTATDLESCLTAITLIQNKGIDALVRIPKNEETIIKKVMDMGANGVIVPMVNTPKEASKAVSYVKYPPEGKRGVGLYRAQGYGQSFDEYKKWLNESSVVLVQIEHIDAIENINRILDCKGVDGIIVGPYDLSASIGKPGEFDSPEVKKVLTTIVDVGKKSSKSLGFHVTKPCAEEVQKKIDEGYNLLAFSLDFLFLSEKLKTEINKLKNTK